MSSDDGFREITVFDRELVKHTLPTDAVMLNWYLDIGRSVGVSYEQLHSVTLRDCTLDSGRFKPLNEFMTLYLRSAQFTTPGLNIPTELSGPPSQQWHFNLVAAGRRSFKKL